MTGLERTTASTTAAACQPALVTMMLSPEPTEDGATVSGAIVVLVTGVLVDVDVDMEVVDVDVEVVDVDVEVEVVDVEVDVEGTMVVVELGVDMGAVVEVAVTSAMAGFGAL